jgi:molybdopterin synthase catalytic subunit
MIEVTQDNFSVDEVLNKLKSGNMGAIAIFVGIVRNYSKERAVERIEIQVYEEMARKQLGDIRKEAISKFGVDEVAIIHRYGNLEVSNNIMMIAVGGGHRPETYAANRWVLEEIKKKVPIWKKEVTPEGDYWVEGEKP